MMLEAVMNQSQTCEEFCSIFNPKVSVQIDAFWGVDSVSIEGYQGTVTTDFIASQIMKKFGREIKEDQEESALKLAELLKGKVFIPLRQYVKKLDKYNCWLSITYKIRNCTRIGWTPEDFELTHGYYVLKHSMCIMVLDKSV